MNRRMEPAFIKEVTAELAEELVGGIVSRVQQSDEKTVVLKLFSHGAERRLLISTHPLHPSIHLTSARRKNPPVPKRFCAFLRSRITNAIITGIAALPGERIVDIYLEKRGEAGETVAMVMRAELTGKSGNIILLDKDRTVLDALRHFPAGESRRAVEPGVRLADLPAPPPPEEIGLPERGEGESWNDAAERIFAASEAADALSSEKFTLRRTLAEALRKARRRLENLKADEARAHKGMEAEKYGELIKANLKRIKKGAAEAVLDDFSVYPPEKTTVPLDETLSPLENAEIYFKRSKKGKRAMKLIAGRRSGTEAEIGELEGLLGEWERTSRPEDFSSLRKRMVRAGYLKPMKEERSEREAPARRRGRPAGAGAGGGAKAGKGEEEARKAEPFRRFTSSEGFEVLCGKSGRANDELVTRYAAPEDIWFHASGVAGSHVIIKVAGRAKELTRRTIEEAAALAAYHSKARGEMKTEVSYTEARNVKKPKGAKPGLVHIRNYRTIRVKPEEMGR